MRWGNVGVGHLTRKTVSGRVITKSTHDRKMIRKIVIGLSDSEV